MSNVDRYPYSLLLTPYSLLLTPYSLHHKNVSLSLLSPLATDPIRVQSCVCCLFWTNRNSLAVTSIFLSISLSNQNYEFFQSALSVNGNIYFYCNYSVNGVIIIIFYLKHISKFPKSVLSFLYLQTDGIFFSMMKSSLPFQLLLHLGSYYLALFSIGNPSFIFTFLNI